jgi:DNA recombination protein RmuC
MEIILYIASGLIAGIVIGFLAAKSRSARLEASNTLLTDSLNVANAELLNLRNEVIKLNSELSATNADFSNLEKKLKDQEQEFHNLANTILKNATKELAETNKEKLNSVLDPLQKKILDFEKKVEDVYYKEAGERNILKGEINKLVELNKTISKDAENLANALKGDKKKQGDWGEVRLELLLQKAGLKENIHYSKQQSLTDDEGKTRRLDFIINLPDEKSLIIDSKVSLNDYTNYFNSDSEEEKKLYLRNHISCIYNHITDLSSKNYHELYGINSPEYVLMYIPIEPAFYLAVENDNDLFLWALEKKNIVLVTTTTLLATLSTISFIWSQENQKRNVLEIAKQSGALYDKFVGFVNDLVDIGDKLESTRKSYTDAMKKLTEGSGNLVKRVENIKQLGAKTSKTLDRRILDRSLESGNEDDELKLINTE